MGAMAGSAVMALYSGVLLKVYLDIFLQKAGRTRQVVAWIVFFAWQYLSELDYFSDRNTLCFTFLAVIIVGVLAYTGNLWKRCSFPIVYLATWMLLEGVASFSIELLSGGAQATFAGISLVSKILLFFFVAGIKLLSQKMGMGKETYGGSFYFVLIPIAEMGLYQTLYQLVNRISASRTETAVWMLLAALALLVLNSAFYPLHLHLVKSLHMKKSALLYRKQIELFVQEKKLEDRATMEIRELRHDMKQSLIYLSALLQNGETEAAIATLEELTGEIMGKGVPESRTGNMVIDSLVNHAYRTAKEQGIAFHLDIGKIPELSIKDTDLCVLLGNALDNALEASERVSGGEIWMTLHYEKGCLLIRIKNRYEGKLKLSEDGKILSGKNDGAHGFGLYSMAQTAKKYGGCLDAKPSEDGMFLTEILVCC